MIDQSALRDREREAARRRSLGQDVGPRDGGHQAATAAPADGVPRKDEQALARSRRAAKAGRAPKPGQRGVRLNKRDYAAFGTLFFADWMHAEGLRFLHYQGASLTRTRDRLSDIFNDRAGYLKRASLSVEGVALTKHGPRPHHYHRTFYALAPKARASVARRLERRGLPASMLFASTRALSEDNQEYGGIDEPHPSRATHAKKVADLYAEVMARLFSEIGEPGPDTWFWRNERRAYRPYALGSDEHEYRPDAELVVALPGPDGRRDAGGSPASGYAHLLIEVQTEASHKGPADIGRKVAAYAHAFPGGRDRARTQPLGSARGPQTGEETTAHHRALYWVVETEAHGRAARDAAADLGVPHHAEGDLSDIAEAIVADAVAPEYLLWEA